MKWIRNIYRLWITSAILEIARMDYARGVYFVYVGKELVEDRSENKNWST